MSDCVVSSPKDVPVKIEGGFGVSLVDEEQLVKVCRIPVTMAPQQTEESVKVDIKLPE